MNREKLQIKKIEVEFSVCKVSSIKEIELDKDFIFLSKTDEEISLVCPVEYVLNHVIERDDGWRGFRIEGKLDFSLIGILSRISGILAENEIGLFAISTFNTDYILVKKENYEKALSVLEKEGYEIL